MGVGFDFDAEYTIEDTLRSHWGDNTPLSRSPLANIFAQNTSLRPFYDVALGRVGDLDEYSRGSFIIGAHAPGFSAVEQAPKLPRVGDGRWTVLIDGIAVNGKNFTFKGKSKVKGVPEGKLLGLLDSGASVPSIPEDAADFLYGSILGSVKHNGLWFVPCEASANVTWYIGYVLAAIFARTHADDRTQWPGFPCSPAGRHLHAKRYLATQP